MSKTTSQLYDLLIHEDELTVLELLDLTAEDLATAFIHRIRERNGIINNYYEDTGKAYETSRREEERLGPRGLGNRSVWEDAGFEIEDEDF
jgi:hypothetical protein